MKRVCRWLPAALVVVWSAGMAVADQVVTNRSAVVIAGHPEAVKLGMKVLDAGGSAADALVTVSLSLGVAEPGNSGLGGKLVLTYYDSTTKKVASLVALEAGPVAVDGPRLAGMTAAQRKHGWNAVCIPGALAGLSEIHKRYGTKPWGDLVAPAVELAEKGFLVDERVEDMLKEFPSDADSESKRIYAAGGHTTRAGERFSNLDLSASLKLIAADGAKALYDGPIGEKIAAASTAAGWPITMEDFRAYRPRWGEAMTGEYRGLKVYTSTPPLTGGSILLASLGCLENKDWTGVRPRDAEYVDAVARVMQQVYPVVNRSAADVPDSRERVMALLSAKSIEKLRNSALTAKVESPFSEPRTDLGDSGLGGLAASTFEQSMDDSETASTTHITIIDRAGNIVCATQSLGNHFGSAVVAPGTGILMNNSINNFSFEKSSINYIAGGKMPRSTMTPTIVLKEGKPCLVIGSPAGQRIPSTVLQVTLDVLAFGRALDESVVAPRFHLIRPTSKSEPINQIDFESGTDETLVEKLSGKGWKAVLRKQKGDYYFGSVNAALIDSAGRITGVADQRRSGDAGGE